MTFFLSTSDKRSSSFLALGSLGPSPAYLIMLLMSGPHKKKRSESFALKEHDVRSIFRTVSLGTFSKGNFEFIFEVLL